MRKFYIRQCVEAEAPSEPAKPLPEHIRDLGGLAFHYQLGCSGSVVPVLAGDSPLREELHNRGIRSQADSAPSESSNAIWQLAARPIYKDGASYLRPWRQMCVVDQQERDPSEIGLVVASALGSIRRYLERYDSNAGESFYLLDFITVRGYPII